MTKEIKIPAVLEIKDATCGLQGWLAIDSLINNRCCGGVRMSPDTSGEEMTYLAKAMTLKYGFLGMPHGGAKAGIRCAEDAPREYKIDLLAKFLGKAKAMRGEVIYNVHPDVGTDREYICEALKRTGQVLAKRALVSQAGGWYTSLTVVAAAKVGADCQGIDLAKANVAVEGFGSVGANVAENLYRLGSRVVAISTSKGALYCENGLDIPELIRLKKSLGSTIVLNYPKAQQLEKGALLELDVQVLLPCAMGNTINLLNASKVKAKLISSGANCPLTREAEDFLFTKNVLSIPYFIANCGGVLGGTMEFSGFRPEEIVAGIDEVFSAQVSRFLKESFVAGINPLSAGEEIARERFNRIKSISEQRSFYNRIFDFGLGLYRRGFLPKFLMRNLSAGYFNKKMGGDI